MFVFTDKSLGWSHACAGNQQFSVSEYTRYSMLFSSPGRKIVYLKPGMKLGHDIYTNKYRILRKPVHHGAIECMYTQSLLEHLNINSSRQRLFVSSSSGDCDEEDARRHQGFKEMIILTYGHAQRHQSWRGHCTKCWWMEACQKKIETNEESLDRLDPSSLIGGPQSESWTRLLPTVSGPQAVTNISLSFT